MITPRALVLRAAGSNCDEETAFAFEAVGAEVELVHINRIVEGEKKIKDFHILAIPGGFTYGDDVSAGKILANELRYKVGDDLLRFFEEGKLIIGICNGFQVLAKAGLLPRVDFGARQSVTLTNNDSGKFEDRWVYLKVQESPCVFTRNAPEMIYVPVAHAEGKFLPASEDVLEELQKNNQIVATYAKPDGSEPEYPWNPNGSIGHVAGICDPSGRIFGLMPHPERHFHPTHHPRWTREGLQAEGEGVFVFRNAVEYIKETF